MIKINVCREVVRQLQKVIKYKIFRRIFYFIGDRVPTLHLIVLSFLAQICPYKKNKK